MKWNCGGLRIGLILAEASILEHNFMTIIPHQSLTKVKLFVADKYKDLDEHLCIMGWIKE